MIFLFSMLLRCSTAPKNFHCLRRFVRQHHVDPLSSLQVTHCFIFAPPCLCLAIGCQFVQFFRQSSRSMEEHFHQSKIIRGVMVQVIIPLD